MFKIFKLNLGEWIMSMSGQINPEAQLKNTVSEMAATNVDNESRVRHLMHAFSRAFLADINDENKAIFGKLGEALTNLLDDYRKTRSDLYYIRSEMQGAKDNALHSDIRITLYKDTIEHLTNSVIDRMFDYRKLSDRNDEAHSAKWDLQRKLSRALNDAEQANNHANMCIDSQKAMQGVFDEYVKATTTLTATLREIAEGMAPELGGNADRILTAVADFYNAMETEKDSVEPTGDGATVDSDRGGPVPSGSGIGYADNPDATGKVEPDYTKASV